MAAGPLSERHRSPQTAGNRRRDDTRGGADCQAERRRGFSDAGRFPAWRQRCSGFVSRAWIDGTPQRDVLRPRAAGGRATCRADISTNHDLVMRHVRSGAEGSRPADAPWPPADLVSTRSGGGRRLVYSICSSIKVYNRPIATFVGFLRAWRPGQRGVFPGLRDGGGEPKREVSRCGKTPASPALPFYRTRYMGQTG